MGTRWTVVQGSNAIVSLRLRAESRSLGKAGVSAQAASALLVARCATGRIAGHADVVSGQSEALLCPRE